MGTVEKKGVKGTKKGKKGATKMSPFSTIDKISHCGIFPKSFNLPYEKRCAPKNPNPSNHL